jgi:hypothetical protein
MLPYDISIFPKGIQSITLWFFYSNPTPYSWIRDKGEISNESLYIIQCADQTPGIALRIHRLNISEITIISELQSQILHVPHLKYWKYNGRIKSLIRISKDMLYFGDL